MVPDWIKEIVLWGAFFASGYYTCHFRLENKFKKELELRSEKLLRKIEELKKKVERDKSS